MEKGTLESGVGIFRRAIVDINELALVARDLSDLREAEPRMPETDGLMLKHE